MGPRVYRPLALARLSPFVLLLSTLLFCSASSAENVSGAELLFEAGREAIAEKDYDLACQKFEESNRLERAAGTLLNLGNCEELRGRLATAWTRYTEAMDMLGGEDLRYDFARRKAEGIEHRVPRLTLNPAKYAPTGMTITRNGEPWNDPLGTPLRLDPQEYVITVEAPRHESKTFHVNLREGDVKELKISPGKKIPEPGLAFDQRRRLGFIFGGAGAGAALAGITFGALAGLEYQTVRAECDLDAQTCATRRGDEAAARGGTFEILAYGLGGLGAVGLAAGGYLLLSKKKGTSTKLEVGQAGSVSLVRLHTAF